MTIPDKPNSRLQKYRLTSKGQALLASLHYRKLVPKEDGKAFFEITPSLLKEEKEQNFPW